MKVKKLGKRTIKTGLAVTLTLILGDLLNLESPFFASIAAIISMQASIYESFKSSKDRMYATIIGGIVALVFSLVFQTENPFLIGLAVIVIIYICINFDLTASLQLASMVFLSIILNYQEGSRLSYAFNRTLDTFIGLIIGTIVNYFVFPHKIEPKVKKTFIDMYYDLRSLLKLVIWNKDIDMSEVRKNVNEMEFEYKILKEELRYGNEKLDFEFDFEKVFAIFEYCYSQINVLSDIKGKHLIDLENKQILESIYGKNIPLQDSRKITRDLDIVYNYHLKEVLTSLSSIEYIFDL